LLGSLSKVVFSVLYLVVYFEVTLLLFIKQKLDIVSNNILDLAG